MIEYIRVIPMLYHVLEVVAAVWVDICQQISRIWLVSMDFLCLLTQYNTNIQLQPLKKSNVGQACRRARGDLEVN